MFTHGIVFTSVGRGDTNWVFRRPGPETETANGRTDLGVFFNGRDHGLQHSCLYTYTTTAKAFSGRHGRILLCTVKLARGLAPPRARWFTRRTRVCRLWTTVINIPCGKRKGRKYSENVPPNSEPASIAVMGWRLTPPHLGCAKSIVSRPRDRLTSKIYSETVVWANDGGGWWVWGMTVLRALVLLDGTRVVMVVYLILHWNGRRGGNFSTSRYVPQMTSFMSVTSRGADVQMHTSSRRIQVHSRSAVGFDGSGVETGVKRGVRNLATEPDSVTFESYTWVNSDFSWRRR